MRWGIEGGGRVMEKGRGGEDGRRERQTDRQTDRQAGRQAGRQAETDRH